MSDTETKLTLGDALRLIAERTSFRTEEEQRAVLGAIDEANNDQDEDYQAHLAADVESRRVQAEQDEQDRAAGREARERAAQDQGDGNAASEPAVTEGDTKAAAAPRTGTTTAKRR